MRYHVDSDRVFLSGFGEGANAAWDVGLSHPDLFAAVVPMAGDPKAAFINRYWPNAIHLPFYLINGEYGGENFRNIVMTMEKWINKGFPCLNVIYQGRGREWFHAELGNAFEWMNRRKRALPFPEVGRWPGGEQTALATMRLSNNHFYWLGVEGIKDACLQNDPKEFPKGGPAQLQGIIRPGNLIEVRSFGLKGFTVWLSPNMIDFNKPVLMKKSGQYNREELTKIGMVKPSLSVMLEDFLERGDNMRLFVARIDQRP